MANKMNSTKVVTGVVRLSYANVWEPASINGSNPKYSVSLIIPKSDKQTLDAINAAVDAAIKEGVAKFGGTIRSTRTPAWDASASLSISSRSVTAILSVTMKPTRTASS